MLHEFVTLNRDAIIAKARLKVTARAWPPPSNSELENGLPLFLTQLAETLRWESTATPFSATAIGSSATVHGRELFTLGFTVSQVVHDYGDICQAITELAVEQNAPISTREFNVLNRCLDVAIADAVTEHSRITAERRSSAELERLGRITHEMGNLLHTSLLAFYVIKQGSVAVGGSTGALLGRSLTGLRDLVDSTLSDIRMAASHHRRELIAIPAFVIDDIAVAARLQAEYSGIDLEIAPIPAELHASVDRQLLASALMNLLNNAFKYTPRGASVTLRARQQGEQVLIEVEDRCGGIPEANGDPFAPFGERRARNRTGLGLGLAIARKAVQAQGGDISVRNVPGTGCVFTIALPAARNTAVPAI